MNTIQLATRVSPKTKKVLNKICKMHGLVMSRFVEEAILDKIEEFVDISELEKLRQEKTRSFKEVIKELKLDV